MDTGLNIHDVIDTLRERSMGYQRSIRPSHKRTRLDIDAHLRNWADWMRARGCGGYSLSNGVSGSSDFEGMCQAMDRRNAAILNTLIDELKPAQRAAVYLAYLGVPYRFPRNNGVQLLNWACEILADKLTERGVV